MKIQIKNIRPSRFQSRDSMNGQPLADLVASMKDSGLAVPIKVRPILTRALDQQYELVYGHRRVEAAKKIGWEEIEAIVEDLSDEAAMVQGLAENIQRDDLEPMEEARAYKRLQDDFGWTATQIGERVGKDESRIRQMLGLLKESKRVQEKVKSGDRVAEEGGVTEKHVRLVRNSGLDKMDRQKIITKADNENLTAEQARQVADAVKASHNPDTKKELLDTRYDPIIHTPEFAKQQDRKREQTKKDPKPAADQEWKSNVDVIRIVEFTNAWNKAIPKMRKSTEIGKLAPEACQYLATKLRQLIGLLEDFVAELDERAEQA